MDRLDKDTARRRIDPRRPGDELREAQRSLEAQVREIFLAFTEATGGWIAAVHVEYLGQASGDRHGPGDIVVRTTLET